MLEPRAIEAVRFALIIRVRGEPIADRPRERLHLATGRQPSAVEEARHRKLAMELGPCAERITHELRLTAGSQPRLTHEARLLGRRVGSGRRVAGEPLGQRLADQLRLAARLQPLLVHVGRVRAVSPAVSHGQPSAQRPAHQLRLPAGKQVVEARRKSCGRAKIRVGADPLDRGCLWHRPILPNAWDVSLDRRRRGWKAAPPGTTACGHPTVHPSGRAPAQSQTGP